MSSPEFILDTDILSLLMRKNAAVLEGKHLRFRPSSIHNLNHYPL